MMVTQARRVLDAESREMARYFYALKDVLRLRILVTLAASGEMTVTELAQALHVSQPLVSFHLRPLRVTGLVQVRRAGREVYCSINLAEIERFQAAFMEMLTTAATRNVEDRVRQREGAEARNIPILEAVTQDE